MAKQDFEYKNVEQADEATLEQIRSNAYRTVMNTYSVEKMAEQYFPPHLINIVM